MPSYGTPCLSSLFKGGVPYTVGFTLCRPMALHIFLLCLKVVIHTLWVHLMPSYGTPYLSSLFKGGGPYTAGFTLCRPMALRVFLLCLKVVFHTLLGSPYAVLWHSMSFFSV